MTTLSVLHVFAIVSSIVIGAVVYRTNPQRATNRIFVVLSGILTLWLFFLGTGFASSNLDVITVCVRGCHCMGAFYPLTFDWLRISIVHRRQSFREVVNSSPVWAITSSLLALVSLTPLLVKGVSLPLPGNPSLDLIAEPVYGPGYWLYLCFYAISLGVLVRRFYLSLCGSEGIPKTELQFILLGAAASIVTGFFLVIAPPVLFGTAQTTRLAAVSVVVLYGVIAYGIATSHIMDIAYFFRTLTAYALLTVYLVALYVAVWWPISWLYREIGMDVNVVPHLTAALALAYSLAPMHGRMQRFANRLFVHFAPMDVNAVVQSANQILQSISTVEDLLDEFNEILKKAVGTDQIVVLLPADGSFVQRLPATTDNRLTISRDNPLARLMARSNSPLVPDVLRRLRPSEEQDEACVVVEKAKAAAAVGMHSKEGLEGILLVAPRLSGRIYGAPEQQALQLLSNQMAVALNNARLYTQLQDSKIYNEVLVDNLASGVIAVGNNGLITIFNQEAQRITRIAPATALRQPVSMLPPELATVLDVALGQGYGTRDEEMVLRTDSGEETPVRVSSSVFYSHEGKILGSFLAMSDLSAVKRLEMQVRRTDRLASLGTLAAGMAHEIKNPLVSIKTFTQLLPERHEDSEFRHSFFTLVGDEVRRIDSIVNQLLRFSRPAKPHLTPTHLHEILNNSLKLMSQQMRQKAIRLAVSMDASNDLIRADGDQLSQAFINLFLNAIESMSEGGILTLSTGPATHGNSVPELRPIQVDMNYVQVSISDTGEGIQPENLSRIFDPFFTTKSQGTGLGLSVAHGIVLEHGGTIDVKSEPGNGTTFLVDFPILVKEAPG